MAELIDICLGISGSFEGGDGQPRWDLTTGNFDGMGLSVGALQWNPGTGSIFPLLTKTFQKMGAVPDEFDDIHTMAAMKPRDAVAFAVQTWVTPENPKGPLTPQAKQLWEAFLATPECRAAQAELAQAILDHAIDDATHYLPWLTEIDWRTCAFFFDVRVQQGGMTKRMDDGTRVAVEALGSPEEARPQEAIDFAAKSGKAKTGVAWQKVIEGGDQLAAVLLHYAYERAILSRPQYQWDTLSRRGAIACRGGAVHGKWVDLTQLLP